MRNKIWVVFSVFLVLVMILSACAPSAGAPAGQETSAPAPAKPGETAAPAAPAAPSGGISPEFKNPDTFTIITGAGEQETMDPAWMYDTASSTIALNIYEGLVFFNRERTDEYIPALATDWTMSDDGKTWVFNIRKGVKFHKGGTLEPHDIAYTTARAMLQGRIDGWQWIAYDAFYGPEMAMASIKDFAAALIGKEAFDDLNEQDLVEVCESIKTKVVADDDAGTVTYNLNQPVPWMLAVMSQQFFGGILDKEYMAEVGDWDGDCSNWVPFADPSAENSKFFNDGNGTGPYMLDHWTPGEETVLVAFPEYWRTEPMWEGGPSGVASIPRVVFKNIDEWGTRLAMFEAGDADYIYAPPQYRPQLNENVKILCGEDESSCKEENPNGYIKTFRKLPMPAITPSQFNWNINVEGGNPYVGSGEVDGNGITPTFFSDEHIRRAFNYCFDFDAMVQDALAGEGVQAQGPIPLGMIGYVEGKDPEFSYDPDKCVEEFKLADIDLDGIPAGEDDDDIWNLGFYMQMAFNTGNDTRRLSSEILKAGLEAVNPKFNISVIGMPWAVLLESRRQGKLPIYVGGWAEDYHDPHNWVQPFLYSQGAYGRIVNFPDEKAAEFDNLILEGVKINDPKARAKHYETIQTKAAEEAVNIWMYQFLEGFHYQTWIDGFYFNPAYGNPEYGWIYSMKKTAP